MTANHAAFLKVGSDALVIHELESRIRSGRLGTGQRLPSVKTLQKMLSVGQASIESAKENMCRRGLIETRRRSGSYTLPNAKEILGREETRTMASAQALDFYLPSFPERTISVYTMDCLGRSRRAWDDVLGAYAKKHNCHVELLTPQDGHLMHLQKMRAIDLVHTTHGMMDAIGLGAFHPINQADMLAFFSGDLLSHVEKKWGDRKPCCSLPFCLTVQYLFINRTLADKLGVPAAMPQNTLDFLNLVKLTKPKADVIGLHTFGVARLEHLLAMTGCFYPDGAGHLGFDNKLALGFFKKLHGMGLPLYSDTQIPELFAAGQMVFARHWSFTSSELLGQVPFEWEAVPLPISTNVGSQAFLSVLALPSSSPSPNRAMSLALHLLSRESLFRFAEAGGNLPVRQSALTAIIAGSLNHISLQSLSVAINQAEIQWPHQLWKELEHSIPPEIAHDLMNARVRPSHILEYLEKRFCECAEARY